MLNMQSLREQLYQYLRNEMESGNLAPGMTINLNGISKELGISKTPLRDALIQLEAEGFVDILPRRGVIVRKLTLQEVKDFYEIIGALEAVVVTDIFDLIQPRHIDALGQLNEKQRTAYREQNFERYYRCAHVIQ